MIIQCDHCSAKFRMDDSKLASGPVKVRCAKCKEVFVVRKDEEPEESFQLPTDFEATISTPTPAGPAHGESESVSEGASAGPGEFSFDMGEPSFGKTAPAPVTSGTGQAEPDEFDWQVSSSQAAAATHEESTAPGEFDFGDFSQGEQSAAVPSSDVSGGTAPQDDFALDFGEVSFSEKSSSETPASSDFAFAPAETEPAGKHERAADKFSGTVDDFGFSFDSASSGKEAKSPAASSTAQTAPFGDFDFGEVEEQPGTKAPEASPPSFKAVAGVHDYSEEFVPSPQQDEAIPPSSLTTRKKRGSLFPLFVIIGAILLIVALVGSGVYFFGGPKAFSKVGLGFLVEWYGQKGGEEGDIVIRNVKAEYVVNKEIGELFVVRGEAVNNYKKPRASIQVKVSLLGSGGSSLKAKSAFCGNPLSSEQLTSLPFAKIEEVMNNQFGDSLANLGVKPGSAIPFVVVINEIPKEAIDYSIQVSGSTVATQ